MADQGSEPVSASHVAQFSLITGIDIDQARFFLESAGGDLEAALSTFYETVGSTNLGAATSSSPASSPHEQPAALPSVGVSPPVRSGPQTLSGAPADEMPAEWRRTGTSSDSAGRKNAPRGGISGFGNLTSSRAPPRRSGISTMKDIVAGSSPAGDMSEDEDEDNRDGGPDLYAGGGRSGLNVQDPNQQNGKAAGIVADILKKAKEAGAAAMPSTSAPIPPKPSNAFQGSAYTLGSEEVPSRAIPDQSSAPRSRTGAFPRALAVPGSFERDFDEDVEEEDSAEEVEKHLTFWKDGFSIEDGPLLDYEDPKNKMILDAINSGRAPLDLLGVRLNQRVTMRVEKRLTENYTPPPKQPAKPFGGSGNRLGSPLPASAMPSAASHSVVNPPTSVTQASPSSILFEVDNNQPVTTVQIRLADGTRMVTRLNHTHTVGDLRRQIAASNPQIGSQPYVLQTIFPSRDLTDENQSIKDAGVLGAVVVQRNV
ncbi:uncharacterized protein MELLADRAFT_73376 [Melampsora larici-populina 98AG31]|uniref:SEP-domain-containing protein n=1 Tax=Melampsora larici-populina (strain 98AG31 / pathotype 3-4-7) TaxID=747676 RepID=F4S776_MELLP|nr:uncharacterized protein MELLADRAFT_73376 [Melampsora larici-populina 98AG31]EGF99520.1 hypothetical protein MELLADRAFT_73376 [Melampsora larici-populina 98AG31]